VSDAAHSRGTNEGVTMTSFELARIKERLGTTRAAAPSTSGEAPAAVATVLREGIEGSEVLFIKRAEREGDPWSGQIAFPGGKREPTDPSLLFTAIRETEEEVSLRLEPAACLARFGDVAAHINGFRVAQFVFALDEPDAVIATSAEVTATLWVPLGRLARFEGAGTLPWTRDGVTLDLPCIRLGTYVLWGLTYRMVLQLLDALREE
jgi:8-oxo-dGTP pyrophosphatase MutT (NUDIX family)